MSSAEKTPVSLADLPPCPVETTLTLISDKWKVLILRDLLLHGTMRFGELKKSIGHVSQKVLTSQLRQMEQSGLVNRKVYAEVPPRVEYSLTELGFSLHPIMDAMWDWGEAYKKSWRRKKTLLQMHERKKSVEKQPISVFLNRLFFSSIFLSAQSSSSFRSFRHTFPAIPDSARSAV